MRPHYMEPIERKILKLLSEGQSIHNEDAFIEEIDEIEEIQGCHEPILESVKKSKKKVKITKPKVQGLDDEDDESDEDFYEPLDFKKETIKKLDLPVRDTAIRMVSNKFAWYKLGSPTYIAIADCALSQAKTGLLELLARKESALLREYTACEAEEIPLVDLKKYLIAAARNHCNDRLRRWSEKNKKGKVSVRARVDLFQDIPNPDDVGDEIWDKHSFSTFNVDQLDENSHLEQLIEDSKLTEIQKEIALLRFREGMTYPEIIEHYGCSAKAESTYRYHMDKVVEYFAKKFTTKDEFWDA